MHKCPECGAQYEAADDNCTSRFDALLALDHSRTEPWGSRHLVAFSAFGIQHPDRFPPDVHERAWALLFKVYESGEDYRRVSEAMRRAGREKLNWDIPPISTRRPLSYPVTIADLGSFPADQYAEQLDAWCRASLTAWRG